MGFVCVVVDVEQVRQVLLGLLGNAARFTERGTIRLTARADDALVTLRVADTGPGIAPEQLPLLFQPFSGPATQAGAGLGLAVCDRLVRVMGGTIEVQTVLGRGSTFTVRLPRLIP